MHLAPGQSVDRYVVESLLGEGGMGTVYQARDTRLGRKVALKVLRKEDADQISEAWEQAVMRMQREAEAIAALSHPGIVAIYDIGEEDGAPFIAMELVVGKPLRELVGTDVPLPVRFRILLDVARALAAAHEAGFLHRDVKPENILVRPDNSPKVLDFGIARRNAHVDVSTVVDVHGATFNAALGMTADGILLGTPAYMAPEQIQGLTLDARADQFAWGLVAYEFLAGHHPFQMERGPMALMASILSDTPAPLENVPEGIAHIVMRALAKEPTERWESMQNIVSQWEPLLIADEGRPSTGSPEQTSVPMSLPSAIPAALPPAPEHVRQRRYILPALTALIVVAVLVWLSQRTSDTPIPTAVVPMASVIPWTLATAITDLPVPKSSAAEARAAYREGMQFMRDARWSAAGDAFQRARKADPEMAAAHLRFAIARFPVDRLQAQEAFRTTQGLRSALSEREAGLMRAYEPIIQGDPSDYTTAAQRFASLVDRYPHDAELRYWYGAALLNSSFADADQKRALEATSRCVQLDPKYADCWELKTIALVSLDLLDEGMIAVDTCIAQCDNSIGCLQDKIAIESRRGRCDMTLEACRQLVAKDSLAPDPHRLHADALFYSGGSESHVRAAGQEAVRLYRERKLDFEANQVAALLDVVLGDFDAAHRQFSAFANPSLAPSAPRAIDALMNHVDLLLEMSQEGTAASLARAALQRYSPEQLASSSFDPFVRLHAALFRAGQISRTQYEAARADWLSKQHPSTLLGHQSQWLMGYGVPAHSKDLAQDALAAAERMKLQMDLDKSPLATLWSMFIGKAYMLVGQPREALPYLERGTRMCTETTLGIWHLQALGLLGTAYESTGNVSLACQTYGKLLARWGRSKSSLTAKSVAKQAQKLQCPAPPQ